MVCEKNLRKWRLPVKRFRFLAVLLLAGLLSMSCGDDDGGSSGGSGVATSDPNLNTPPQQATAQAATTEAATTEAATWRRNGNGSVAVGRLPSADSAGV